MIQRISTHTATLVGQARWAAAERRGKSVQAILTGLAEVLAADESDGAKRVAAIRAGLCAAAPDPYFTETTVEQRDAARDEAWS